MKKIVFFFFISAFGGIGWYLAEQIGFGLMATYVLSVAGSIGGVVFAVFVNNNYVNQ